MVQDRQKLREIITKVNDYLVQFRDAPASTIVDLNSIIKSYHECESIIERLAVIRSTYAFRHLLSEWAKLVENTKSLCIEQDMDPRVVMVGLLD